VAGGYSSAELQDDVGDGFGEEKDLKDPRDQKDVRGLTHARRFAGFALRAWSAEVCIAHIAFSTEGSVKILNGSSEHPLMETIWYAWVETVTAKSSSRVP
jgi:hypothetical protein